MPNWKEILDEVASRDSSHDQVRRKYLKQLSELTKRNVIVYYSGWLQKPELAASGYAGFELNDSDKNGFMACCHGLDREDGLDLVLHTPGGGIAPTESLVDYLRGMFGNNIRAIVPQLAMSAGTMIALACREVVMGKHSSLGPIDPQMMGLPAHGVIEEFQRAAHEIAADQSTIPLWQPIIAKYNPTLVGECQKAINWSENMVRKWLETGMFADDDDRADKAERIIKDLGDHSLTLSHDRHISLDSADQMGLKVAALEDDDDLQDAVLSVHHSCVQTLTATPATKIIENQLAVAFIQSIRLA